MGDLLPDPRYHHLNRSGRLQGDVQTNNRAELTAVITAIREAPAPIVRPLIIHSDSRYTIGIAKQSQAWARSGYRNAKGPIAIQDLIRQLRQALRERPDTQLRHVKRHSGIEGKELADHLAVQGTSKPQTRWSRARSKEVDAVPHPSGRPTHLHFPPRR
jgi:ribonuclease HI